MRPLQSIETIRYLKTLASRQTASTSNTLHGWNETDRRRRKFSVHVPLPSGEIRRYRSSSTNRSERPRAGPKSPPRIFSASGTKCQNLLPSGGFCRNTVGPLQVLKGSGSFPRSITEITCIGEHDLSPWPTRQVSEFRFFLDKSFRVAKKWV